MALRIPSSAALERWPWFIRFFLGCCLAIGVVTLTTSIPQLRPLPLVLALPTVVLAAWFLGMSGAAGCAFTDVVLFEIVWGHALRRPQNAIAMDLVRLVIFVLVSLLLGWCMRRLSQQKAALANHELARRLELAESERLLAEERARASEQVRYREDVLQIALKASGTGLWVWDLEKDVVLRSDEVFRMSGRDAESCGPDSESWLQFIHPEDLSAVKQAIATARVDGSDFHMQYRVYLPDGSIHWLESHGRCQRDEQGKVIRIFGVLSDITQRKQAEEAMLRTEKLAVAGRLAASVAHEINNPLEAVANLLYLISIGDSLEQSRIRASAALDELMRISLVAQSTLKFHKQTGFPKPTLLSEVLDSVLDTFRGRLHAMEITVDMKADQEFPISCMPSEAHQIFANLVANSIESMEKKGRITIRIRPAVDWCDRCSHGMRVTIGDTGIGIDPASRPRIFEPFYTTKSETGTGLGLWVVQQLVERQKGNVCVRTTQRPGRSGSVFSVFLPFGEVAWEHPGQSAPETAIPKGIQQAYPESYSPGLFLEQRQG
jgi:PAS domain S-box-containing protein